jgi:hypothetical protein
MLCTERERERERERWGAIVQSPLLFNWCGSLRSVRLQSTHYTGWVNVEQNGTLLIYYSILCIKEELGQLSLQSSSPKEEPPPCPPPQEIPDDNSQNDSSKASVPIPGVSVGCQNTSAAQHSGWIDGLLGCLRPVWTIIGKAATNEIKGRQGE